jgi:putative acetyltransferase
VLAVLPPPRAQERWKSVTSDEINIRPEQPGDETAIAEIVTAAFGQAAEADLVGRLRAAGALTIAQVALRQGEIVGHVALSPVSVDGAVAGRRWLGLAPLAVRPDLQRRGIGGWLVQSAVDLAVEQDAVAVFVLGRPAYYERLGFEEGAAAGWRCIYDVPAAAFRVWRVAGSPDLPPSGTVRYHPAFDGLE